MFLRVSQSSLVRVRDPRIIGSISPPGIVGLNSIQSCYKIAPPLPLEKSDHTLFGA